MKAASTQVRGVRKRRSEGAVMYVVMATLLTVSAVGLMAVKSAKFEQEAAGQAQVGLQAQQVAESGLASSMGLIDSIGAGAILHAMREGKVLCAADANKCPTMEPFEVALLAGKQNYRIYNSDFTEDPVSRAAYGGTLRDQRPSFFVDINDEFVEVANVPGERVDGRGNLRYFNATYTSRGRIAIASEDIYSPADARGYHERSADARAQARSGPFVF